MLDIISAQVYNAWKRAATALKLAREGNRMATGENFEYLAVRAAIWQNKYADGTYPHGSARMSELEPDPARVPTD